MQPLLPPSPPPSSPPRICLPGCDRLRPSRRRPSSQCAATFLRVCLCNGRPTGLPRPPRPTKKTTPCLLAPRPGLPCLSSRQTKKRAARARTRRKKTHRCHERSRAPKQSLLRPNAPREECPPPATLRPTLAPRAASPNFPLPLFPCALNSPPPPSETPPPPASLFSSPKRSIVLLNGKTKKNRFQARFAAPSKSPAKHSHGSPRLQGTLGPPCIETTNAKNEGAPPGPPFLAAERAGFSRENLWSFPLLRKPPKQKRAPTPHALAPLPENNKLSGRTTHARPPRGSRRRR